MLEGQVGDRHARNLVPADVNQINLGRAACFAAACPGHQLHLDGGSCCGVQDLYVFNGTPAQPTDCSIRGIYADDQCLGCGRLALFDYVHLRATWEGQKDPCSKLRTL